MRPFLVIASHVLLNLRNYGCVLMYLYLYVLYYMGTGQNATANIDVCGVHLNKTVSIQGRI